MGKMSLQQEVKPRERRQYWSTSEVWEVGENKIYRNLDKSN